MKKQKKPLFGLVLFINILFTIGIIVFIKIGEKNNTINDNSLYNVVSENKINELKEEKSSLSLVMVGDNLIHSNVYKDANKYANYNGYDFKPILEHIKPIVKNFDLAYYNQETILGGTEIGLSDYPTFNSPYEAGDAMIDAGFNLVSLTTNDTIDRGEKATLNSRTYWNN